MHNTGMLFTSLVSLLVSISAFVSGVFIFKKKSKEDKNLEAYSWFLLVTGAVWFFVSLDLFASWLGVEILQRIFFIADQFFVFCSGPALAYYLTFKIFKKKKLAIGVTVVYFSAVVLAMFSFIKYGIVEGEVTYFASKFLPNEYAFLIFVFMLVPLLLGAVFDCLFRVFKWIIAKKITNPYEFFYSLVIVIYLVLGIFDEQGFVANWGLVFFRLIDAAVFLMAYLTFYFQHLRRETLLENVSTGLNEKKEEDLMV